jgi:FtsZ-interacting cell division protein ZipA
MHVILLALGLFTALAGLALVAFGIATNAGAFGNTLIIVGTIAIVGGLILVGLASAIWHLRRIAQALESRPLPRALGREPAAAAPHVPFVAPLSAPRTRAEHGAEAPAPPPPPPPPEPAMETPYAADRDRVPPREEMPQPAMSERPAETPPRLPEPQPMPEAAAEQKFDTAWMGEPAAETPHDVDAGRISATEPEPADKGEDAWAPAGADDVRIFKSGVIDGMAYTLYTDGSIEAELAQGTVKFSSIDELRAYLATRE